MRGLTPDLPQDDWNSAWFKLSNSDKYFIQRMKGEDLALNEVEQCAARALGHWYIKNLKRAHDLYSQALDLDPNNHLNRFNRANLLMESESYALARADFELIKLKAEPSFELMRYVDSNLSLLNNRSPKEITDQKNELAKLRGH